MELRNCTLCDASATEYSDVAECLHSSLLARHVNQHNLNFAKFICENLLDHCSKLHSYVRGGQAPQTQFSSAIGSITSDPGVLLEAIHKEWSHDWGCDDPLKVADAAKCIRAAREEALLHSNHTPRQCTDLV